MILPNACLHESLKHADAWVHIMHVHGSTRPQGLMLKWTFDFNGMKHGKAFIICMPPDKELHGMKGNA